MMRKVLLRVLFVVMPVALLPFAWVADSAMAAGTAFESKAGPGRDGSISGTVRISGCDIEAGDLRVRARPIHGAPGRGRARVAARGGPTRVMRAIPAGAANEFLFHFHNLDPDLPHRIGVKLFGASARRCPRFAWDVDREPLVLAGDEPLAFHGYAVRSELAVLATADYRDTGRMPADGLWVGADTLNFRERTKAIRTFRWKSDLPGVTGGQLQLAVKRFPRIQERAYRPCGNAEDEGVIQRVDFAAQPGELTELPPVDFNAVILGGGRDSASPIDRTQGVDAQTLTKLYLGMPIYTRVVPRIGPDGELECDPDRGGVPPEVIFSFHLPEFVGPPAPNPELALGETLYAMPYISNRPWPGETCYRAINYHEASFLLGGVWDKYAILFGPGSIVHTGDTFCVPDGGGGGGWFESALNSFGSVLSAIVDGVGVLVNFTSNLWEEIQDYAVNAVASAVDDVGLINCGAGSNCRAALETGLEVALASMGVPPSLPNFDQLVDQGFDYMAAQIASEAGVPSELSDYASSKAQEFVKTAAADMSSRYSVAKMPGWLVPDLRFHPGALLLELFGRGLANPYYSRPGMIRGNSPVYAGAFTLLPKRLPSNDLGETPLVYPMVLQPNLDNLPPAPSGTNAYHRARKDKKNWTNLRYKNGCYHLVLTGLSDPGGVTPLLNIAFRADVLPAEGCTP